MKYYFASKLNLGNSILIPRVPKNKYNSEDDTVERICVSQSINGCLTAIGSRFDLGDTVYIHQCESEAVMQPTVEQVVDVCLTGEQWILEPVTMKLFMKIVIIGKMDASVGHVANVVYAFRLCEEA